jgi:hypothetical protein
MLAFVAARRRIADPPRAGSRGSSPVTGWRVGDAFSMGWWVLTRRIGLKTFLKGAITMLFRKLNLTALVLVLVLALPGNADNQTASNSSGARSPQLEVLQAAEQARRLVIDDILSGDISGKAIYMVKSPIFQGTIARGWKPEVETFIMPYDRGWFFFIDDHPMANWEHPCRYVFIDYEAKEYKVFEAFTPPDVWEKSISPEGKTTERRLELEEIEESIQQRPKETEGWREEEEPRREKEPELERVFEQLDKYPQTRRAVLISGGYDTDNNHSRYLKDLRHHYVTLTRYYGYADGDIDVLYADGSNYDLDCDGDNDVDGNALKATVTATFNALPAGLDHLHVFVTNHGGTSNVSNAGAQHGPSHIWLWNQEKITDAELAALVIAQSPECATYILEQCYSGGCIDDLKTSAGKVVVAAACKGNQYSWACDTEGDFDEYVYHHTSAHRRFKPAGDTPAQICVDGAPVNADANANGIVSFREAHNYAKGMDSRPESPQFAEKPAGQGSKAWLGWCEGANIEFDFTWIVELLLKIVHSLLDTVEFQGVLQNTGTLADSFRVELAENPPTPEEWWVQLCAGGVCWDSTVTAVNVFLDTTEVDTVRVRVIPRTQAEGRYTVTVESYGNPGFTKSETFRLRAYTYAIPVTQEWGLIILAMLILASALYLMYRRYKLVR